MKPQTLSLCMSVGPGEAGTLWLGFLRGRKELTAGAGPGFSGAALASPKACLDYSRTGVSVTLGADRVAFADDACAPLASAHGLGTRPLYVFVGAECACNSCSGGPMLHASLPGKHACRNILL